MRTIGWHTGEQGAVGTDRSGNIILFNGKVLTGELGASDATGVAIVNGKVAWVGNDKDVLSWKRPGRTIVDLEVRSVTPGLYGAHSYQLYLGLGLAQVDASILPHVTISGII